MFARLRPLSLYPLFIIQSIAGAGDFPEATALSLVTVTSLSVIRQMRD